MAPVPTARPGTTGGNATASKRIRKEIADLAKEDLGDIVLTPNESNIFQWKATLPGPVGSPYEGGKFDVDINIPENYPFAPPHLRFITKLYHCNVASTGAICLDLLKTAWSPALSLYKVILSLSSLLTDPNPSDPLVPQIAQEYRKNRKKHDDTAREWVKLYALTSSMPAKPAVPPAPVRTDSNASSSSRGTIQRIVPPASIPSRPTTGRRTHSSLRTDTNGNGPTRAIEIDDSDGDEVEPAEGPGSSSGKRKSKEARPTKRTRTNGGGAGGSGSTAAGTGGSEDVIVIDD